MDKFLLSSPTQLAQPYDESTLNFDIYDQTINLQQQFKNFNNNNNIQYNDNIKIEDNLNLNLNNDHQFNSQQNHQQYQQNQVQLQQHHQQQLQQHPLYSQNINLQEKNNYYTPGGNDNKRKYINNAPIFENEIVPVSTNLPDNKSFMTDDSGLGINIMDIPELNSSINGGNNVDSRFNHSRNISLDEHMLNFNNNQNYSRQNHYNHQHNDSVVSINQNAPIGNDNNNNNFIPNSFSSNTIYSLDSIPSFESPVQQFHHSRQLSQNNLQPILQQQQPQQHQQNQTYQNQQHSQQQSQQQQHHQFTSTPRRAGRNKSLSISTYTTPMRNAPSFSPINLATTAFNKVSKTPAKNIKGHSRSRSKVSLDAAAAALASKTNSASSYNSSVLNPFYTPSQMISSFEDDDDDVHNELSSNTPLLTPGSYKLKTSQSTFFSPYKSNDNHANSDNNYLNPNFENQENDAIKQLKKAKSYSNLLRKQKKEQNQQQTNSNQQQRPQPINSFSEASILTNGMLSRPAPKIDLLSPEFKQQEINTNEQSQTFNQTTTIPSPFNNNNYNTNLENNIKKEHSNSVEYSSISLNLDNSIDFSQQQHQEQLLPPQKTQKDEQDEEDDEYENTDHHTDFTSTSSTSNTTPSLLPPMVTFSTKEHRQQQHQQQGQLQIDQAEVRKTTLSSKTKIKTSKSKKKSPNSSIKKESDEKILVPTSQDQDKKHSIQESKPTINEKKQEVKTDPDQINDDDDDTVTIPIPENLNITRPKVRNNRSDKELNKTDPKKKHKCPICDARFQRPEHVKRHLKSHSSEKPFQCNELNCGKRFNRKDNLKAHLKKIHGILNGS
ncbi:CAS5 [Candida pseudojiufengensis]|uniref:CAS5 n=1 Tax=Candida pseudojiufengensis TaxID=497109 RepID=UPI002224FA54|nr:CAS5 [Candida pseudojiufengensis]KAI5965724.1 CAS5 [Candida pseudojiufengensis]